MSEKALHLDLCEIKLPFQYLIFSSIHKILDLTLLDEHTSAVCAYNTASGPSCFR